MVRFLLSVMLAVSAIFCAAGTADAAGIFDRWTNRTTQGVYHFVVEDGVMVSGCCRNGSSCWMMDRAMKAAKQGATHVRINGVDHPITYRNTKPAALPVVAAETKSYRTVARTITETKRVKFCVNGQCFYRDVPETRTIYVREEVKPVAKEAEVEPPQKKVVDITYEWDPTPEDAAQIMVALARVTDTDVVYDLGCGDGRILEYASAAKKLVGIEYNAQTFKLAQKRLLGRKNVQLINGDLFEHDYADADVVFLYLYPGPGMLGKLASRLKSLRPGARVVSYLHDIPGIDTERVAVGDHEFFVYQVPDRAVWQEIGLSMNF